MGKMKQLLEREDEMDNLGYWSKAFVIEAIGRMESRAISTDARSYYGVVRQYFETLAGNFPEPRMAHNPYVSTHPSRSLPKGSR
jgi:hypothetical protein